MRIGLCGGPGPLRHYLRQHLQARGWTTDPAADLQLWLPPPPGEDFDEAALASLRELPAGRLITLCDDTTCRRLGSLPEAWVASRRAATHRAALRWQDVVGHGSAVDCWLEQDSWAAGGLLAPLGLTHALARTAQLLEQLQRGEGWGQVHPVHGRVLPAREVAERLAMLEGSAPRLTEVTASPWTSHGAHPEDTDLDELLIDALRAVGKPVEPAPPQVPFVRPNTWATPAVMARWQQSLASGWLSNGGPVVRELEARLAERLGVADCVVVSSGAVALQLLARTARSGDVVLPSYTFIATGAAFHDRNLRFADLDAPTLTLCPDAAARAIEPGTTGVVVAVNAFGVEPDVARLAAVAEAAGAELIVDDAHGLGTPRTGPAHVPRAGSLHATKQLVAAEGGWVTGPHERLARVRQLRDHGRGDQGWQPGLNGRMDELRAALALDELTRMEVTLAGRRKTALRLRRRLALHGWWVQADPDGRSGFQDLACALPGHDASEVVAAFRALGVEARRYFAVPLHHLPAFPDADLPVTDASFARLVSLPLHNRMRQSEVRAVLTAIDRVTEALCS